METNNKYYTPTRDEFFEGFEFEFNTGNEGWRKDISDGRLPYSFFTEKYKDLARVKYLDKEDIESLGWKYDTKENYYSYMDYKEFFKSNNTLFSNFKNKTIGIWDIASNFKFNGIIKNKSELKKLMKQLGINNEEN